jgi:predicted GNAT family acetyltransferase
MNVVRCESPRAFLGRAEAFLLADEACHNLLLGVPARLMADPAPPPAPPYFAIVVGAGDVVAAAMMTPPRELVLSRTAHPRAVALIAQDLLAGNATPPGVHGPVPVSSQFAEAWRELTGQRSAQIRSSRISRLERVRPLAGAPGRLRPAIIADRSLLVSWVRAFFLEAFGAHQPPEDAEALVDRRLRSSIEGLCLWEDGGPRALAGYAGPTPHGVRVGPVYTPPGFRERGYASACVAALSQRLLDRGRQFCFLYTDLANPTSNRIYQRIGYEPVCDTVEYRFRVDNVRGVL